VSAERVLILAPTGRDAPLASELLQRDGFSASTFSSMGALCADVGEEAGALLIGEEALDPQALGLLVETLDRQPPWSDIPVIVLAGREFAASGTRPLTVLGPLRNVLILERPVRRLILARTVAIALRSRQRQLELRAYLEERADLLRREQAANRMKDEFLMTVSHELRTPLTAIYGWAHTLLTGEMREDRKRRAIEAIERNAEAQVRLVNDLLDVSRAISGKTQMNVRAVDLNSLARGAIDSIQPAAEAKGIRLHTEMTPDSHPILGDPDRLLQVVWNLLSNAVKFTPAGGLVRLCIQRHPQQVTITVADTGRGIDAAFLPYVFDRFRQGDSGTTREYSGLGLGLAIVRHLVELHGGSVTVESPGPGQGATFQVVLPVTPSMRMQTAEVSTGDAAASDAAGDQRTDGSRYQRSAQNADLRGIDERRPVEREAGDEQGHGEADSADPGAPMERTPVHRRGKRRAS
jgi:signal transduction histidine kinase